MITPTEIKAKLKSLYPRAIVDWLSGGTDFFPRRLPANLRFPKATPQSDLIRWITALRENSKGQCGYGYTLQFDQVHSRTHGANAFPIAVVVESLDDLLRSIGKLAEFRKLESAVELLRQRQPSLAHWPIKNWKRLLPVAEHVADLLTVVDYLVAHPRPECYLRELPLPISTKLIEDNRPLLREWLDLVLAPEHIDFGGDVRDFERRYGFCYPRRHILVRLLDPELQSEFGFPCSELSLPAAELRRLCTQNIQVFLVENKINLLTLPAMPRSVALGGLGNNVAELRHIAWLANAPLWYWGDLDIDGLAILARMRHAFPHTRSLLMDLGTLMAYRDLWTTVPARINLAEPLELEPDELAAFRYCRDHNLRLEQEHIPQGAVLRQLERLR